MDVELVPAILVHTKEVLEQELLLVEGDVTTVQIDIMDGHFVPDTTVMPEAVTGISTSIKYEMHMMVQHPESYLPRLIHPSISTIILHIESSEHCSDLITKIKALNKRAALALNPETPLERILPFLNRLDMVLVMTVQPGKGGQKFIPAMLEKIAAIRKQAPDLDIEVDGGINEKTIHDCYIAGANRFVVGSAIFQKQDIHKAIETIRTRIKD